MKNKLFISIILILALSVAGIAYAAEDQVQNDTPKIDKRQKMKRPPGKRKGPPMLKQNLTKGAFRTKMLVETPDGIKAVRIDRGEIISVNDTQIEIEEKDGKVVTIAFDDETKFRGKKVDELSEGDKVQSIREKAEGEEYKTRAIMAGKNPGDQKGPRGSNGQGDQPPLPIEG